MNQQPTMHRNTKQRKAILSIFSDGALLTAAEVVTRLPNLDRSTVYRTLNRLVSEEVLREVSVHKAVSSYELRDPNDHHQHFICQDCHTVLPVEIDQKKLAQLVPKAIQIHEIELNLKGQCPDCVEA